MAGKEVIKMTQEELKRLHVIHKVLAKEITQVEAAKLIGLSDRQVRTIVKRIKNEGDTGIIHRSRGRDSNRKFPDELKRKVIVLYKEKYPDFRPTFASEKLLEIDKIKINHETLRGWLIEAGIWERERKHRKHRQWRERKHYFGEMVQVDGSHHDWFEGRGPKAVFMGYIDDATNTAFGRFYEYEGTIPAMDSFKRYIKRYGLPQSIYIDKYSTYKSTAKPTIEDELNNRKPKSQFGRAVGELEVEVIYANSPQAKGRIERLFGVFQDRLIKEMRLKDIRTIKEANSFLGSYLPKYNRRFNYSPMKEGDLHRAIPEGIDLDKILCIKTKRGLRNDFTISHDKKLYQVLEHVNTKKVMVEEKINGSMLIMHKDKRLKYKEIEKRPVRAKAKKPYKFKEKNVYRPPMDHPWKRPLYERNLALKQTRLQRENARASQTPTT